MWLNEKFIPCPVHAGGIATDRLSICLTASLKRMPNVESAEFRFFVYNDKFHLAFITYFALFLHHESISSYA